MRMSGPMRTAIMSLADLLAAAHAGVVPLGHDIGQAVVDDDLDLDVGILAQKLRELRQQDRIDRVFRGRDPDGAGGLLAKLAERRKLGIDLLKPRADGAQQAFARLGRRRRCASCASAAERRAAPRARGWCG